jgi:hypothetical protein
MIPDCLSEMIERMRQLREAVIELERENDHLVAELARLRDARSGNNEGTFKIEQWNPDGSRIDDFLGSLQNAVVARSAFREYVRQRPNHRITLAWGGHGGGGMKLDEYIPGEPHPDFPHLSAS